MLKFEYERARDMVFKTKVGITFYIILIFIFATILFIASLVFLSDSIWAKWLCGSISLLLAAVFAFHLIPMITNTYYRFDDEGLFINAGRLKVTIPYANVISFSCGVKSMLMQPALSFKNRLEIKYKTKGGMTDIVHISPVNEEEFVKLLNSKI